MLSRTKCSRSISPLSCRPPSGYQVIPALSRDPPPPLVILNAVKNLPPLLNQSFTTKNKILHFSFIILHLNCSSFFIFLYLCPVKINYSLVRLTRKRWEGRTRSVPEKVIVHLSFHNIKAFCFTTHIITRIFPVIHFKYFGFHQTSSLRFSQWPPQKVTYILQI